MNKKKLRLAMHMHDGNLEHIKCKTSKDFQEIERLKERKHEWEMKK